MKKAKHIVQELIDEVEAEAQNDALQLALDEDLKPAINNLLWQYLPDKTNIKSAEILASVIYEMVRFPDRFLEKPAPDNLESVQPPSKPIPMPWGYPKPGFDPDAGHSYTEAGKYP